MECNTLRFELEPAEIEQATDAAFKVIDHVFVVHTQHASRQHLVPVSHELEVRTVVTRNVIYAVSELLAIREQLLEVAEATRHRLATRIDDARVGQHQVNQTDVPEVVWHLVDEKRPPASVDSRAGQIFLSKLAAVLRLARMRG